MSKDTNSASSGQMRLARFQSADKSLEDALNYLAEAIERGSPPQIDIPIGKGTLTETPGRVIINPDTARLAGARVYQPWKPVFYSDGALKVKFNLGTVNGVPPTNWDTGQAIGATDTKFPVLNVTTSSGSVTGATISLDASAPTADTIAQDTPPSSFKICLGMIKNKKHYMIYVTNLEIVAEEVFKESVSPASPGDEPYRRWWRWNVN
jgi:hypothetical protein